MRGSVLSGVTIACLWGVTATAGVTAMAGVTLSQQPTGKPQPATTKPQATTAAQLQRGKAVFDQWCASCHAPGPRHPGTQALDALYKGQKPGALEQRTDLVPKLTETFVRKGVSVMAPYRKTEISDADLAALAAYLAPKTP